MVAAVPKDALDWVIANIPVGRLGRPQEMAHAIRFVLHDDAAYVRAASFRSTVEWIGDATHSRQTTRLTNHHRAPESFLSSARCLERYSWVQTAFTSV
jgi:hypothetical protein